MLQVRENREETKKLKRQKSASRLNLPKEVEYTKSSQTSNVCQTSNSVARRFYQKNLATLDCRNKFFLQVCGK